MFLQNCFTVQLVVAEDKYRNTVDWYRKKIVLKKFKGHLSATKCSNYFSGFELVALDYLQIIFIHFVR